MANEPTSLGRDQPPHDGANSPQPEGAPKQQNRRAFIARIASMTFLTAAVAKLGVTPVHAMPDPVPIDPYCGKPDPDGGVYDDRDCGGQGSNGDQDCGKSNGLFTHEDNDCVVSGGDGADNDCGKAQFFETVHQDNDCSEGAADQDCGQKHLVDGPDGPTIEIHTDSDGSAD
jgi:hypothetical protein